MMNCDICDESNGEHHHTTITLEFPKADERRRYALLQAAAILAASRTGYNYDGVVREALELLAEIEKKEAE